VTNVKILHGGYAARLSAEALARIKADPNVLYVQMDGRKSVNPIPSIQTVTPSWALSRIDQRSLPLDDDYSPAGDGKTVNVAIIDTGVTNQAEFEGRLQEECFSAHSGGCVDGHGHGTHVAGTIGSHTWGVAKSVTLWAVRVLDSSGSGSDSDVIRGINWVASKAQLASPTQEWVINMSLGGSASPALVRAVCAAISSGVSVVVAAGNEYDLASNGSPARVRQAITVGAMDYQDKQGGFSNFGPIVDILAPGVDVKSLAPRGNTDTMSGTSMAAPHVAGAVAIYQAGHPGLAPQAVRDAIVAMSTKDVLSNLGADTPNRMLYVEKAPQ